MITEDGDNWGRYGPCCSGVEGRKGIYTSVASPATGHWGTCPPPSTSNNFIFSSLWSRPKADSHVLCSLRDQLVPAATTHIRSVRH